MEQPWWIDHQARDLVAVGLKKISTAGIRPTEFY